MAVRKAATRADVPVPGMILMNAWNVTTYLPWWNHFLFFYKLASDTPSSIAKNQPGLRATLP
jgi:hypothetical protein